jgi:RNA 3'-terminal phosphate cyclase (ATP)
MLHIDASYGEGGGQLVRTAVALSAITGQAIRLDNVRAKRDKPGLAPQHLTAVQAVASLCNANCEGLELRAQTFNFAPRRLHGGEFRFDVGTAGSITLVLQALLPALLCAREPSRVSVIGGTDVRAAPPLDYFRHVLLGLLGHMGAKARCRVLRRGYYPRGGGEVEVAVEPAHLTRLELDEPGQLLSIEGCAHVAHLPLSIAERMRTAAVGGLADFGHLAHIDTLALGGADAMGTGGAVACWATMQHTVLGAGRVAERGVRAETLSEIVGVELASELAARATLDIHAADQILIYLALAGGHFTTRTMSSHAQTAIWLIEQFLPVHFEVVPDSDGAKVRVATR